MSVKDAADGFGQGAVVEDRNFNCLFGDVQGFENPSADGGLGGEALKDGSSNRIALKTAQANYDSLDVNYLRVKAVARRAAGAKAHWSEIIAFTAGLPRCWFRCRHYRFLRARVICVLVCNHMS